MSNALAIATVTETLVQVLQGALTGINLGSSPHVTNTRPDQQAGLPPVGVNVLPEDVVVPPEEVVVPPEVEDEPPALCPERLQPS